MEHKKRPKNLRGGKGTLASKADPPKYHCRNHGTPMTYSPLLMGWECPESGCTYRRYRKSEVDQYGPPLVCEGPHTLVIYGDHNKSQILIRGSNNVAVDITGLVTSMGTIENHSGRSYEVTLEFLRATQIAPQ